MSYQVFARKYRPQTFADVLGQDHVVRTLSNAIAQNRLAHAYLFVGPRGTGKTSTARIFAKALNGPGGPRIDFDPNDPVCREIAEGNNLDVLEIDGASNNGVDQVRDLRETVKYAPASGKFKIYYIDEVHMLTTAAFNALLKTLEEPPPHVKFIFATTEANKVLPTIISRCQRFDLRRIPDPIIAAHLLHIAGLEGVDLEEKAAYTIAKGADGGMRDAQSMLDQLVAFCGNKIVESDVIDMFGFTSLETVSGVARQMIARDTVGSLRFIHAQAEAGKDLGRLLSDLIQHFRTILVYQSDPDAASENLPPEIATDVAQQAQAVTTEQLLRLVDNLTEVDGRLRWASNKRLHLEIGIIQGIESLAEVSLSDVIEALDKAGGTTAEAGVAVQARRATVPVPTPAAPPVMPAPRQVAPAAAPAPAPAPMAMPPPRRQTMDEPPPRAAAVAPPPREEAPPAPVAAPSPAPSSDDAATSALAAASASQDLRELWSEVQSLVATQRPLLVHWVRVGTQLRVERNVVVVGFPTSETHSRDSLERETTKRYLEDLLSTNAGQPMKLQFVIDETLTVVEEPPDLFAGATLPPLHTPAPAAAPAPAPAAKPEPAPAPKAPEPPAESGPSELEKEFYNDPLIKAALETFKAKVVKPS